MSESVGTSTQPIVSIAEPIEYGETWTVGRDGVTYIEAYREAGEMALVPWIRVYVNGAIRHVMAARHVRITYGEADS